MEEAVCQRQQLQPWPQEGEAVVTGSHGHEAERDGCYYPAHLLSFHSGPHHVRRSHLHLERVSSPQLKSSENTHSDTSIGVLPSRV